MWGASDSKKSQISNHLCIGLVNLYTLPYFYRISILLPVIDPKRCAGVAPRVLASGSKKRASRNYLLHKALRMEDNGLEPMTFWLPDRFFLIFCTHYRTLFC
jgi:hypothetical protein